MKILKILVLFSLVIFTNNISFAQKKEKQIIEAVSFETNKIILNKKPAYNYIKDGNNFTISNLDNQEIIKGQINSIGNEKFSSIITFLTSGKKFSNEKIIGRNDLIFALCESNVIKENFEIDESRLNSFIEKYNQLE